MVKVRVKIFGFANTFDRVMMFSRVPNKGDQIIINDQALTVEKVYHYTDYKDPTKEAAYIVAE